MLLVGFEPTIAASERPKAYALGGTAIGTGTLKLLVEKKDDIKRFMTMFSWETSLTDLICSIKKNFQFYCLFHLDGGHAIFQAASRRTLTAEARVQFQAILYEICSR
jgi:hypothetical protein